MNEHAEICAWPRTLANRSGEACTVHRPNAILSGCVTGGVLAFQATDPSQSLGAKIRRFLPLARVGQLAWLWAVLVLLPFLGCAAWVAEPCAAEHPSMSSASGHRDPDGSLSSCSVNASWVNRDVAIRSASKKSQQARPTDPQRHQ